MRLTTVLLGVLGSAAGCSTFEKMFPQAAKAENAEQSDEPRRAATLRIHLASAMEELGGRTLKDEEDTPFSLESIALLTEADLLDAYALHSPSASGILLHFTPFAADQLYAATCTNVGKSLAILVNDEPIAFVRVITPVRDERPMIRGNWSRAEAEEIAETIREALPTGEGGVF